MTIGHKSGQAGNALSLQGESEIRQESSAADALTITLASGVTSTAGGQGLVVRRFAAEGASGGTELFAVEYDGTRGRRHVVTLSTATSVTMASSQSGAFVVIPAIGSGVIITLPAVEAGLWYEFYIGGLISSGGVRFEAPTTGTMTIFNDVAADYVVLGTASGASIGGSCRLISNGTKWHYIDQPAFTSEAPATATMTSFHMKTA